MQENKELEKCYRQYIEQQTEGYEIIAKIIGYTVERMAQEGLIDSDVQISGRLKSFKSTFENDRRKGIVDCFGVRIVAKDEKDKVTIMQEIEKVLTVHKTRIHGTDGKERYKGIHHLVSMNEQYITDNERAKGINYPLVEVQYWTKELEKMCVGGELAYSKYKKKDLGSILELYRRDPEAVYSKLPICYEIKGNSARVLGKQEALFKIYPEIEAEEKKKEPEQQEPELC